MLRKGESGLGAAGQGLRGAARSGGAGAARGALNFGTWLRVAKLRSRGGSGRDAPGLRSAVQGAGAGHGARGPAAPAPGGLSPSQRRSAGAERRRGWGAWGRIAPASNFNARKSWGELAGPSWGLGTRGLCLVPFVPRCLCVPAAPQLLSCPGPAPRSALPEAGCSDPSPLGGRERNRYFTAPDAGIIGFARVAH